MDNWLNILLLVILISIILMEIAENGHPIRTLTWILLLVFLPVSGNLHMNRMNIRQGTDPFQDIGGMTDNVLHILGRGPGNAGERADSRVLRTTDTL